jgi:hypothetical protein
VLFVNVPFSAVAFVGAFLLLKKERRKPAALANFDNSERCSSPAACCSWSTPW